MADLNLSFPYPINYNAENISKELEEYGQLLNKTLLVEEGLTYKEYNSMIDTDNPDVSVSSSIVRSTIDNNFKRITFNLSQLYEQEKFKKYIKKYRQINPLLIPTPEWKNCILHAFSVRFYMFYLDSSYPINEFRSLSLPKDDIPICKELYPAYMALLQAFGNKSDRWKPLKKYMLELIEQMLPFIDSAPKLESYNYWLNLFLPDDLLEILTKLENLRKETDDFSTRQNIKAFEIELIFMKFHSLTIQTEYYSQISPILIDYLSTEIPPLSRRAFDISKYYASLTDKKWQETILRELRWLYLEEDSNIYDKFSNSKNTD